MCCPDCFHAQWLRVSGVGRRDGEDWEGRHGVPATLGRRSCRRSQIGAATVGIPWATSRLSLENEAQTVLVFTQETGEALNPDRVSNAFRDAVLAAGLPLIRLHDLRHTHASLGLAAGIPAKVMSERLGHSTVSITLDTYSHVLPGMQEDAGAKIAALFA